MANSAIGSQSLSMLSLPSGMLVDYAGTVEPSGWLMCDGRAISREVYSSLFSSIGITYGSGDGSTTFNLPDFRGRFARYKDNMETAAGAANRDTASRNADKSQGQATAKNNLTVSDPGHNHALPAIHEQTGGYTQYMSIGFGYSTTYNGYSMLVQTKTTGVSISSSDTETRPINLSCNRIIKI
jgi:microcystin-dependent protein